MNSFKPFLLRSAKRLRGACIVFAAGSSALACAASSGSDGPGPIPSGEVPIGGAGGCDETQGPCAATGGVGGEVTPGGEGGGPPDPDVITTKCAGSKYIPPSRLVRVEEAQYRKMVVDLVGPTEALTEELLGDERDRDFAIPPEAVINTAEFSEISDIATTAANSLTGDRLSAALACTPGQAEDACATAYFQRLASRAFGRAINEKEDAGLLALYNVGAEESAERGVQLVVRAILQSPSMLFRSELGPAAAAGTVVQLSPQEMAGRLGSLLLDSVPDLELASAANEGRLNTTEQVLVQVDRLLQLPRVQAHLTRTLVAAYGANRVFGTVGGKDPELYPEFNPGLIEAMYEGTRLFVEQVVQNPEADLNGLLTSKTAFVNPALADIYGVTYPGSGDEFAPVQLPADRAGILTEASVLTTRSRADATSVVARGLYVRGELLCLPKIPAPPAAVREEVEKQISSGLTESELAEQRAANMTCGGCHAQFDRFGLLLESFDAIGRFRAEDGDTPIDTSVDLTGLGEFTGEVENASAFATQVVASGDFQSCLAQNLLAYSMSEPRENASAADCNVTAINARLTERGFTLRNLIHAIVSTDAFQRRLTSN